MLIALDAMGGDHAPAEIVAGALLARNELSIETALVGSKDIIEAELTRLGEQPASWEIVHATEAIAMDEHPAQAVRTKRDASINVGMDMVKRGVAGGFVSAGNTGAVMASALMTLGRIQGIERPALGTLAPFTERGVLVLDVGANADVKPSYMVQFAQMGSVYAERVMGVPNPRIALLNIGSEDTKGSELVQEVHGRLQHAGVNFVGNIEGGDVHHGNADVIVTDGFTGNVAVKVTEGVADFIFRELRSALTSKLRYKLAAMVLRPALLKMRDRMDPGTYGGVPLLGVNGFVLIAHGNSNARAVRNALRTASEGAQSGMLDSIRTTLGRKN
ncbi:MAG TPA: phosphate acyltransferase PlsX, partial [Dehalococcoidia bacterium]|nr:phosphate acyltransferase PlsX [Dehalococcoidia bacterium]